MSKLQHSKSGKSQSSPKNAKFLLLLLALAEFQHADRKNLKGKSIKSRVGLAQNEEPKFKSSGLSSFARTKHNTHIQYRLSHLYYIILYSFIYIYIHIMFFPGTKVIQNMNWTFWDKVPTLFFTLLKSLGALLLLSTLDFLAIVARRRSVRARAR